VGPNLKLGPFVQIGVAEYMNEGGSVNGTPQTVTLNNKSVHEMVTFGLRIAFLP